MSKPRVLMAHKMSSPLMVLRFSRWHLSDASEVIKDTNSETHSWMVSLPSFATLAEEGSAYGTEKVRRWERTVQSAGEGRACTTYKENRPREQTCQQPEDTAAVKTKKKGKDTAVPTPSQPPAFTFPRGGGGLAKRRGEGKSPLRK